MNPIFSLSPLKDPRWTWFVERNPKASVFHSLGWFQALNRTYGYAEVYRSLMANKYDDSNRINAIRMMGAAVSIACSITESGSCRP